MKYLVYQLVCYMEQFNQETEQTEKIQELATIKTPYSESALEEAKNIAYKGEYTIEEVEEPVEETLEERTAALEEAINLLLEGATE